MTKYLNAEEMLNNYEADCEVYENNGDSLDAELWMVDYLKNHSSADVQPVVHAHWKYDKNGVFWCSKCECIPATKSNFCPHCGAKMDGDEHER